MTPGFSDESEELRVTAACWGRREATREERDEGGQSGRIQRPKKKNAGIREGLTG